MQAARPQCSAAVLGRSARPQMPASPAAQAATANRSDGAELPARKSSRLSIVGRQSRGDREEAEERQSRRRSRQAAAVNERQLQDKTPATPIERPAGKISLWCVRYHYMLDNGAPTGSLAFLVRPLGIQV